MFMNMEHDKPNTKLAFQATLHCLTGCGLGDIFGFVIGTALGLSYYSSVIFGIFLGFILGFGLGILPLLRAKMTFKDAMKVVIATEFFSILVMETAETIIELIFPGMKKLGLIHIQYWIGLGIALFAGFIAAYPVNLYLVKQGVRHHH
jgi:hypothetical protein